MFISELPVRPKVGLVVRDETTDAERDYEVVTAVKDTDDEIVVTMKHTRTTFAGKGRCDFWTESKGRTRDESGRQPRTCAFCGAEEQPFHINRGVQKCPVEQVQTWTHTRKEQKFLVFGGKYNGQRRTHREVGFDNYIQYNRGVRGRRADKNMPSAVLIAPSVFTKGLGRK